METVNKNIQLLEKAYSLGEEILKLQTVMAKDEEIGYYYRRESFVAACQTAINPVKLEKLLEKERAKETPQGTMMITDYKLLP